MLQEDAIRTDTIYERGNSHGHDIAVKRNLYVFPCNMGCGNEIRVRLERLAKHSGRCRPCASKNRKDRLFCHCGKRATGRGLCGKHFYEKYKVEVSTTNKKWLQSPRGRWSSLQRAVRNSGLPSDLTSEKHWEILQHQCDYCGEPLNESGHGLDRKNSLGGYTEDNVVPCCVICNRVKNRYLTYEEMKVAMAAVIGYRKTLK